jgi:hypothetical protein
LSPRLEEEKSRRCRAARPDWIAVESPTRARSRPSGNARRTAWRARSFVAKRDFLRHNSPGWGTGGMSPAPTRQLVWRFIPSGPARSLPVGRDGAARGGGDGRRCGGHRRKGPVIRARFGGTLSRERLELIICTLTILYGGVALFLAKNPRKSSLQRGGGRTCWRAGNSDIDLRPLCS